jgi:tripartite-type tricarboxylate transporter receptor subunit TctC
MTWTKCFQTLLVPLLLSALCGTSSAQVTSSGSNTPIKIIVPFTPGTGMDTIARTIQPRLAERTGQTVLVQNMPGASGNIGADFVAKSAPDGTTLLMGANTMLIASQLYKNTPFNPIKDFAPVSMSAYGTLMLVAHPKTDIKSVKDLVRVATSKPGFFTFGSPGVGTPHHMAMELLKLETKTFMLHVPYRGTAGYTQDLLAGELMVGFLPVHVAQGFVKSGKLNALAVGSTKRHPVAAEVPTFLELGYKDIDVDLWYAFFVPTKTPAATVSKLHADLSAIIVQPTVKEILGKAGLDASASTPEELASILAKDYPRWGRVIQLKGISGE